MTSLFGTSRDYRKVGHSRITWLGTVGLWEGQDHFLQNDLIFAYEYYKRFYYKDIKAFTLSGSRRGAYWHWILGALTTVFSGLAVYSAWGRASMGGLQWTLIAFAGLASVAWLIHFLLGPTCVCCVVTPVQRERLRSLARVRSAQKTLNLLASRVRAAQGELPQLSTEGVGQSAAPASASDPYSSEITTPERAQPEPSRTLSVILFALSLAVAGGLFAMLLWQTPTLRTVTAVGVLAVMALAISCLATRRVRRASVAAGWILVVFNFALFMAWYIWAFVDVMKSGKPTPAVEVEYFKMFLNASTQDSAFLRWSMLIAGAVNLLCGAVGLLIALPAGVPKPGPPSETTAVPEGK